jgi:uncharacterized radical SAM superfamily Fe-S cluster-containing enzyme
VRYVAEGGQVFLERLCPTHGKSRTLVAESLPWFLEASRAPAAARPPQACVTPRTGDCPSSCGPCSFHAQRCHLPVLSITNVCDLRCPICFTYNRADRPFHMTPDELDRHLDYIIEATGGVDLVDITGGEPTAHPALEELLARARRRPEIGRVALNTNGLRLAREPELARRLAALGIYVVLSLDTLERELSCELHGRDIVDDKRRALEHLERAGVQTTILHVLVAARNEAELPALLELLLGKPFLRSLCVQTMTYTGQGGGSFGPRRHLPVDGVVRRLAQASGGRVRPEDFLPLPTAHPLCYAVAYYFLDDAGHAHPLVDLLGRELLARHGSEGYLLHPGPALEAELRAAIDRLWSRGERPELLSAVKQLLEELYPAGGSLDVHERQRRAERRVKTIYVHAHMDEDSYEVGRAMRCPDQVPVIDAGGRRLVGACNYNLFYRMRDARFWIDR